MPWGMNNDIIGFEALPDHIRMNIRDGIALQRDGDAWIRYRVALVEPDGDSWHVVDDACVDHWIDADNPLLDPDAPLPEPVGRDPKPGDLIRLTRRDDPAITDITRYKGLPDGPYDGWDTTDGLYLTLDWTLDGVIEE